GRVIIEDQCDIGALTTINKGVSGDTRIGKGTKVDCHVHIGHGVEIGEDCIIAGGTGIAGKTIIGNRVLLQGKSASYMGERSEMMLWY
ncbi:MAG: UDP-3-O-(3-hydroxymyristoyl)glucosamine N-acyltransferase, partial [Saprospiraceae bacterium]|nr:UDP-3-O-(3-hydroxymyristoyl)glucosamine N-acyltransferase [Saprospiraceae bacterium]